MRNFCLIFVLLICAELHAETNLTFSQAYNKFNEAYDQNDIPNRVKYSQMAYNLGIEKFGKDSENSHILALNYGLSLVEENKRNTAKERIAVFKKVIEGFSSIYGEADKQLIEPYLHYQNAVKTLRDRKKRSEGINFAIDGLKEIEEQNDSEPLLQAYIQSIIAGSYASIGNSRKASRYYENSYNIYNDKLPKTDYRLGLASFHMGKVFRSKRRNSSAKRYFEQALQGFKSPDGRNHQYEVLTRAFLVPTLEAMGESEKATEHCIAIGEMTPWAPNQKPQPLYRVEPVYPVTAARNRKEGWVKLSFSISESGFVEDIKILERSNQLFEKVSIKALENWRYAPKFVNGKAVKAKNLTVQLDYKLARH